MRYPELQNGVNSSERLPPAHEFEPRLDIMREMARLRVLEVKTELRIAVTAEERNLQRQDLENAQLEYLKAIEEERKIERKHLRARLSRQDDAKTKRSEESKTRSRRKRQHRHLRFGKRRRT